MAYKAEYIWIDGTEPTAKLRSKTKIITDGAELPIWGFDGSSTNQAEGRASDCVLKPVFGCPDPVRGGNDVLVMCEVLLTDMTPHPTNTRAALREVSERYAAQEPLFGTEQEYTFFEGSRPLGFPAGGFPAPQGGYYCGVGADEIFGRPAVERHLQAAPWTCPTTCGGPATATPTWSQGDHRDRLHRPREQVHGVRARPGPGPGLPFPARAVERRGRSCQHGRLSPPARSPRPWPN